ncbi:glycerophosphodiester phosphodiesterase family protein [Sutcliffiella halmapala]|uniref:glycerophosphodiester phosphodiesterase family protein n=1 Tax=Sutcliffiella halmapala TaxID=79882 RepID=UPI0009953467|nr:glycerophosphodiester phosphodiesterase family protein [Sutcliffiella halmapala]
MKTSKKVMQKILIAFLLLLLLFFINNTSLFSKQEKGEPLLLAHRGVHQTFSMEGIQYDTCTAERIFEPEHAYIENTIPSMKAAFEAGADMVELDVHPTTDGEFAVFHDWTLECRTNGQGATREHSMDELRALDVGYGYTADEGQTYPLRGKGVGLIPTLGEVLQQFPNKELLIHIKSDDPEEGKLLANYLSDYTVGNFSNLSVYGGDNPIATLKEELPELRVMSKASMKSCLIPYFIIGWTGYVPETCGNSQLHIPEKIGPWLWGWSGKFHERMEKVNTRVILVAGDGGFSEGFDQVEDLERIPEHFSGWIWTNRIDLIGSE